MIRSRRAELSQDLLAQPAPASALDSSTTHNLAGVGGSVKV